MAANPAGTGLYVTNIYSNKLTVFRLDASGNIVDQQQGSPFDTWGVNTRGIAVR